MKLTTSSTLATAAACLLAALATPSRADSYTDYRRQVVRQLDHQEDRAEDELDREVKQREHRLQEWYEAETDRLKHQYEVAREHAHLSQRAALSRDYLRQRGELRDIYYHERKALRQYEDQIEDEIDDYYDAMKNRARHPGGFLPQSGIIRHGGFHPAVPSHYGLPIPGRHGVVGVHPHQGGVSIRTPRGLGLTIRW